jgi:hypothetical protein
LYRRTKSAALLFHPGKVIGPPLLFHTPQLPIDEQLENVELLR